jgi:DNA repair protein RecO (recombination protein O)
MRISLEPAYILHQRPYRNTSALLELFTGSLGRVGLVARGVRSERSRLRGVLQPFRPLLVSWSGRGELGTLTGVESDGPAFALSGRALVSALYVNELLMRLLHRDDPHDALFRSYQQTLRGLAGPDPEQPVLRVFEKRLLEGLGYGLVLTHAVDTGAPIESERLYGYRLEHGPVSVAHCDQDSIVVHGSTLLALAREDLCAPDMLAEAKRLMRAALGLYLGDRPLKSRELLRTRT